MSDTPIQRLGELLDALNDKGTDAKQAVMIRLSDYKSEHYQYIYVSEVYVDSDDDVIMQARMAYGLG